MILSIHLLMLLHALGIFFLAQSTKVYPNLQFLIIYWIYSSYEYSYLKHFFSLVDIESYIEGEFFLMFLHDLTFYIIFFFNNHDFSLCYSCSTYVLMYFVKCFKKHEDLFSFCDKKGE
jgi:hypothetical protein